MPALVLCRARARGRARSSVRARHGRDRRSARGSPSPVEEIIERDRGAGRRQELRARREAAERSARRSAEQIVRTLLEAERHPRRRDLHPRRRSTGADVQPDAHGLPNRRRPTEPRSTATARSSCSAYSAPALASGRWRARSLDVVPGLGWAIKGRHCLCGHARTRGGCDPLFRGRRDRRDCGVRPVPVLAFREHDRSDTREAPRRWPSRKQTPGSSTSSRLGGTGLRGGTTRSSRGHGHVSTSGSVGRETPAASQPGGRRTLRLGDRARRQALRTVPLLPCEYCAGRTEPSRRAGSRRRET